MPSTDKFPEPFKLGVSSYWNYLNSPVLSYPTALTGRVTRSWDNTANYWSLRRQGVKLPTRRYDYLKYVIGMPTGQFTYYPTSTPNTWHTNSGTLDEIRIEWFSTSTNPSEGYIRGLYNHVGFPVSIDSQLLDKIKDMSINLAQAFGERKQTANLIASSVTRLAKSYSLLRKGNLSGALNQLGAGAPPPRVSRKFRNQIPAGERADRRASSAWLELTYGWKPLLSDVYGSAEAISKASFRILRRSASVSKSIINTGQYQFAVGYSGGILITRDVLVSFSQKKKLSFIVSNPGAKTLAEIGVSNPALLAWELLPYSFVVDWALPIGSYLSNIDATAGCTFLHGSNSYKRTVHSDDTAVGRQIAGTDGNWTYVGSGSSWYAETLLKREEMFNFPSNPVPSLKNPLSPSHVTSAIALLVTAFRGR